ncbi:MAG: 2-oxo acid dehydrogenase subunit E2, partial [Candidatus Omnitrophica bacterium]|nr:2-oxo acid dehydrogenase subunit E2 [Candidatus Omnitrophota bacterium]
SFTREDVQRTAAADVGRARPRASETLPSAQAAVARAVSRSHREIVPLRITARIDMTAAKKFHAESAATGSKISYDALFLKVLAAAIREIPLVAARLEVDQIIFPEGIHLALAIGLDNELFLPVVHNVGQKSLAALESEIQEVVGQVKNHTLKYGRMTGGCMAISNLGMYPIETFEAIIFPEHSAILAIGAIQNCPVAVETRIEVRPMATVNLTVDHRLINGRLAARFLTRVKQSMEAGTFA